MDKAVYTAKEKVKAGYSAGRPYSSEPVQQAQHHQQQQQQHRGDPVDADKEWTACLAAMPDLQDSRTLRRHRAHKDSQSNTTVEGPSKDGQAVSWKETLGDDRAERSGKAETAKVRETLDEADNREGEKKQWTASPQYKEEEEMNTEERNIEEMNADRKKRERLK